MTPQSQEKIKKLLFLFATNGIQYQRRRYMKDIFLLLLIIVVWFVLNKYILPRMGVPT